MLNKFGVGGIMTYKLVGQEGFMDIALMVVLIALQLYPQLDPDFLLIY
ncbi:MAG: hypothetical protein ACXIUQ_02035 [Cecembia sp.]